MPIQFKMRGGVPGRAAREAAAKIAGELNIPPFVASTLVARGICTPDGAREFVSPSLERDWLNPCDIAGIDEAVDMLEGAVKARKHIVVFGDFDLDGISATTVMTRGIRALGGRATPFIPRRFEEGYGLSDAALERAKTLSPDMIVTVDCGISCAVEVARAVAEGIDVVVTDHHEASQQVPQNVPVVDPKAQAGNPSAILAGVGVALKVVQVLGSRFGFPHLWRSYTDFATLGTVADLMPMLGENRALVADGLRMMNDAPRPCIAALAAVCGMADKELTASNLSFSLVPRLNAAGRMGNAEVALELLMSDSFDEASLYAQKLDELNASRRRIESELSEIASAQAEAEYAGERAVVVGGEGWHEGVKGIVASRLVGMYGVPALLFTIEGGEARGSGRSVGNVNLFKAVESVSDMLIRFGGHGAAVGVTLEASRLAEFKERLCAYLATLPEEDFQPMMDIDAVVSLEDLTLDSVRQVELLAPFGQENPEPVFLAHGIMLDQCRAVGADKNHFSCKLTDGLVQTSGILFHCKDIDELLANEALVDAVFTVQVDEWRGMQSVKAMLKALAPAHSCGALDACVDPDARRFVDGLFDCACGGCECSGSPHRPRQEAPSRQISGDNPRGESEASESCADLRKHWSDLSQSDPASLEREIVRAIIGDALPHATQREMLDRLRRGQSVLGVMATGRGKSLVFQVHAAMIALTQRKASLFIYPLRALMSDQAYHLGRQFGRFGLTCRVLNGETPKAERDATYAGLCDGTVDIVLTTPEYLSFHAEEIARCSRIGFMVIDEAHHIGQAKAGARPAYRQLGHVASMLGDPVVLAVTATANDDIARSIADTLPIAGKVIDDASRDNLHIDDRRGIAGRDDYLAHIVAGGQKCVVYVNSREQSVGVARRLRARAPHLASMIGFYNAGLAREERSRIEELFRDGELRVLVATSAFGEGIDIPDIRHVVLYHMPFSDVEFNQMSGRAGRDGADAWVHLLYGRQDARLNQEILEGMTPGRDTMAQVYRRLRALQRSACDGSHAAASVNGTTLPHVPDGFFTTCINELAELSGDARHPVSAQAAACGVAVFSELGLIEAQRTYNSGTEQLAIRVAEGADKVELTDSVRYCEGLDEISDFMAFREWAMKCDIHSISVRVTHPITPRDRL